MEQMLDLHLQRIEQIAIKSRIYFITSIILAVIIIVGALLFWKNNPKVDISQVLLLEKERQSLIDNNISLKRLISLQGDAMKSIKKSESNDSNLIKEILKSRQSYTNSLKNKPNEIKVIDNYSSRELQSSVAAITGQYKVTE